MHGRVEKSPPIKRLTASEANRMLQDWHYLGRVRGIIAAFGHAEGCCVFTNLRSRLLERSLSNEHPIELARMVGAPGHRWAMTSLMAQSLREIRRLGYTFVVTYADPWNGNTGTVYLAGNWIPSEETLADTVYLIDGKRVSRRSLYDKHGTQSKTIMRSIYGNRIQFERAPPKRRFIIYLRHSTT